MHKQPFFLCKNVGSLPHVGLVYDDLITYALSLVWYIHLFSGCCLKLREETRLSQTPVLVGQS